VTYNFRFDPVIYATDEIKGDECNPVFNYSKTHCIDNFDAFILQSFQTEMVRFCSLIILGHFQIVRLPRHHISSLQIRQTWWFYNSYCHSMLHTVLKFSR
jgi:hypothetical protein